MKFYPADWRSDPKLRMCSIGARGLWVEMLCVMHEAEPYGYLVSNCHAITSRQMAGLAGITAGECMKYLLELASAGVYSLDEEKIFSRRMVRDKAKADADRENGKGGGNPKLKGPVNGGDNPPDKAQKPETREPKRKKDSDADASGAEAPIDPSIAERDYFTRGREVLGKEEGAMIAKLLKAKGGNVPLARAAMEAASQKERPLEYIAGCCKAPSAKPLTEYQRAQHEGRGILNGLRSFASGSGQSNGSNTGLLSDHSRHGSTTVRGGFDETVVDLPLTGGRAGR
jgi:hypothetical protein